MRKSSFSYEGLCVIRNRSSVNAFDVKQILKDKINGVHVPQFKIAYILDTTHPSYEKLVKLCHEVHYIWWENQYLELQEWEDRIK